MLDDRLLKTLMLEMVEGKRQPPHRSGSNILMWFGQVIKGAMTMMEDRDRWRTYVASSCGPCWPQKYRREEEEFD